MHRKPILKNVFTLFLIFIAVNASAQLAKNSWMIGGSIAIQSSKAGANKYQSFNATPTAGIFIIDKLAAGLNIDYNYYRISYSGGPQRSSSLGIGPFVRYYLLKKESVLNILGQAGYQYYKDLTKGRRSNQHDQTFIGQAGPAFFLNRSVALEFLLSYKHTIVDQSVLKENFLGFNIGFQVFLDNKKHS